MRRVHSIRIPVHGFVEFDDWERDIINHPVFQRLRRIRQLALSEQVYPGSTHTRFEHSLGVMHVATRLYDAILHRYDAVLKDRLNLDPKQSSSRTLVRLAALLHDVGHSPFSHTGEGLMPRRTDGKPYRHEDYSTSLIEHEMKDVLDDHLINQQHHNVSACRVAEFLKGDPSLPAEVLFWRDLIDGQLDADRMDYLLRDSLHCGVSYGHFDLDRIVDSVSVVQNKSDQLPSDLRIAISEGGRHAAEGLILARYFMFQQVYFHPVRLAYDHHVSNCLKAYLRGILRKTTLPDPSLAAGRRAFLKLDDSRIMNFVLARKADPDATAILEHVHDRKIYGTSEQPTQDELKRLEDVEKLLKRRKIENWSRDASKDWYTLDDRQIQIAGETMSSLEVPVGNPLSHRSTVISGLGSTRQRYVFVPKHDRDIVERILRERELKHG